MSSNVPNELRWRLEKNLLFRTNNSNFHDFGLRVTKWRKQLWGRRDDDRKTTALQCWESNQISLVAAIRAWKGIFLQVLRGLGQSFVQDAPVLVRERYAKQFVWTKKACPETLQFRIATSYRELIWLFSFMCTDWTICMHLHHFNTTRRQLKLRQSYWCSKE